MTLFGQELLGSTYTECMTNYWNCLDNSLDSDCAFWPRYALASEFGCALDYVFTLGGLIGERDEWCEGDRVGVDPYEAHIICDTLFPTQIDENVVDWDALEEEEMKAKEPLKWAFMTLIPIVILGGIGYFIIKGGI